MKRLFAIALLAALGASAEAQTTARPRFLRAVGQGTASGAPDQAKVDAGVNTQAATAQDAASQNADKTTSVINALKQALGPGADIRTINYSLNPVYKYDGGTSTLVGFSVSNTVEATVNDISTVGRVIDAAVQGGATNIQSLRFLIKDDQPLRVQALRAAAIQARQHVDAMALGLGVHTGNVLAAEEGVSYNAPLTPINAGAPAAATPIQVGSVDITATVTLDIEITQ